MAEAIDPVNGLPSECDYLPTIAKVKGYLEPHWLSWQQTQERIDMGTGEQVVDQVPAQHDQRAMRQVDDVEHAPDQRHAECHEAIQAPEQNSIE